MIKAFALETPADSALRFNSLHPGPMRTGLRAKGYVNEAGSTVPLAKDRVGPLLWLLGPDSRGVTGQAL
jgi:NAD(P)-dependent dehydrogenase (short-subunit alcohol dehydrogenase family)